MSSRRSNGRSPLVNQQRQITSFFTKSSNSSPSPSPASVSSKLNPKSLLNPKPSNPITHNRSPSPSPTTPSPLQSKQSKPLLVIGPSQPSPSTPKTTPLYGQEVVNRRIKVYWPLDKSWYEGCVKSFDKASGEHSILYDDAQEEVLDLSKEKTQWCDEQKTDERKTPKFRRLRRVSVIEDDDEEDEVKTPNSMDVVEDDDDSTDEDWGKNVDIEAAADEDDDLKAMDLDKEDEEEVKNVASASKTQGKKKRTMSDEWMLGIFKKKSKSAGDGKKTTSKVSGDCNGGKLMELKAGLSKW